MLSSDTLFDKSEARGAGSASTPAPPPSSPSAANAGRRSARRKKANKATIPASRRARARWREEGAAVKRNGADTETSSKRIGLHRYTLGVGGIELRLRTYAVFRMLPFGKRAVARAYVPCYNMPAQFHSITPLIRPGSHETGRGGASGESRSSGAEGARRKAEGRIAETLRQKDRAKLQLVARTRLPFFPHISSRVPRPWTGFAEIARTCLYRGGNWWKAFSALLTMGSSLSTTSSGGCRSWCSSCSAASC